MPLATSAPYDTLATVTQLVRTILADYIQGIVPSASGTVTTAGTAVSWVSGAQFNVYFNGALISINGVSYQVLQVSSPTTLSLTASAGVQPAVAYLATIPTGDIFADSQAYVVPTVNLAWRKTQKKLADKGHPRLQSEIDILALPIVATTDPAIQQWINWTQFFDGVNTTITPVLPADFISPLRLWERQTGMTSQMTPMHPAVDGLRARDKGSANRFFDWRGDAIYLPGSLLAMDLRIRYAAFLPDIVAGNFSSTQIPIMRTAEALAYYAAAEFVTPRGSQLGPLWEAKGDDAIDQITNAWQKLQQRGSFSRKSWGSRSFARF